MKISQVCRWRAFSGAMLLILAGGSALVRAEEPIQVAAQQTQLSFAVDGLHVLAEGDQLAVELDGYDVTALLSRRDSEITLDLPTPLAEGSHPLLVLVFYADGNVATLLDTRVEVAQSAVAAAVQPAVQDGVDPESSGQAELEQPVQQGTPYRYSFYGLLSNNYRIDERTPSSYQGIPRYATNGAASYRGQGGGTDWQWQAELDAMYDNLSENNPTGYEWELPNYRMALSRGAGTDRQALALGNYNVFREDMLFSAYQRRGVAVSLGDEFNGPLQVDVFGLQSEPLTVYRDRLGYPVPSEERTAGALFRFSPLRDDPQLLQVSGGYLDGQTTDSGTGWYSPDQQTLYGGNSSNIALDSRLGENSLWLHADFAYSSFDSDGLNLGQSARSDHGSDLQAQFTSGSWFPAGPFDQWNLTLQQRETGLNYYTLGNLFMPGDLQLQRANWQGMLGNLQLEAEVAGETNNLDNSSEIPDQTTRRQLLNLYYYPMVDAEALPWKLLGMPSLNAGASQISRRQSNADAQLAGYDVNDDTRESVFGASFYHNRWNWSVQQTYQDTDDNSFAVEQMGFVTYDPPSDQRNRFTTLQVGFIPLDQLSLSTSWQWNKLQETDDNNVTRSVSRGADMAWQIVPERWRLNASYYNGRDSSNYGDADFFGDDLRQQTAYLQLTWSHSQPRGLEPGLDWFMKGSYVKQESQLFDQGLEDWQLIVGFDLRWDTHSQ